MIYTYYTCIYGLYYNKHIYIPRDLCLFGWGDRSLGLGDPGGGTKGGIPMSTPFPTPLSRHKCDSAVFFFFSVVRSLACCCVESSTVAVV